MALRLFGKDRALTAPMGHQNLVQGTAKASNPIPRAKIFEDGLTVRLNHPEGVGKHLVRAMKKLRLPSTPLPDGAPVQSRATASDPTKHFSNYERCEVEVFTSSKKMRGMLVKWMRELGYPLAPMPDGDTIQSTTTASGRTQQLSVQKRSDNEGAKLLKRVWAILEKRKRDEGLVLTMTIDSDPKQCLRLRKRRKAAGVELSKRAPAISKEKTRDRGPAQGTATASKPTQQIRVRERSDIERNELQKSDRAIVEKKTKDKGPAQGTTTASGPTKRPDIRKRSDVERHKLPKRARAPLEKKRKDGDPAQGTATASGSTQQPSIREGSDVEGAELQKRAQAIAEKEPGDEGSAQSSDVEGAESQKRAQAIEEEQTSDEGPAQRNPIASDILKRLDILQRIADAAIKSTDIARGMVADIIKADEYSRAQEAAASSQRRLHLKMLEGHVAGMVTAQKGFQAGAVLKIRGEDIATRVILQELHDKGSRIGELFGMAEDVANRFSTMVVEQVAKEVEAAAPEEAEANIAAKILDSLRANPWVNCAYLNSERGLDGEKDEEESGEEPAAGKKGGKKGRKRGGKKAGKKGGKKRR